MGLLDHRGLPVLLTGGATAGNVTLSNPVLNAGVANNNLNITPGSAVISVTGGAQIKQGL